MNVFLKRLATLTGALFIYALGIVITMKANLGFAPWEVFTEEFRKPSGYLWVTSPF